MMMTLFEKMEYINNDFRSNPLYQMREIPNDKEAVSEFLLLAMTTANEFENKYKGKGQRIEQYVRELTFEWIEDLEKEYYKKYPRKEKKEKKA